MKVVYGDTRLKAPDDVYVRCKDCSKTFIGKAEDERCRLCADRHARSQLQVESWFRRAAIECPHCKVKFTSTYGRKYCSDKCSDAHRAQDAIEMAQAYVGELNLGAATGYLHALYRYLADRDGDECYLCGRRVRLTLKGGKGPSVDHLIPRSKGGTHELANSALVHKDCNSRKGNRPANEQLRLLG